MKTPLLDGIIKKASVLDISPIYRGATNKDIKGSMALGAGVTGLGMGVDSYFRGQKPKQMLFKGLLGLGIGTLGGAGFHALGRLFRKKQANGIYKTADISLPDLAKILNKEFGTPFMPEGYVKADIRDSGGLNLNIGNRDVSLDEDGKVTGAGSLLVGGWKRPEEDCSKTAFLLNGIIKNAMIKAADLEKLKKKHGITKMEDGVGFSPTEKKYFGWSHRAFYGFGIGSKTKKGDAGYIPSKGAWTAKTMADAKQMAMDFAEGVS